MFTKHLPASLILFVSVSIVGAQDEFTFEGAIDGNTPFVEYALELAVTQPVIITLEAADDTLDPIATLLDPSGTVVAENDDDSDETLDSRIQYTAESSGVYTVRAGSYGGTTGRFVLTIFVGLPNPLPDSLEGTTTVYQGTVGEGEGAVNYPIELNPGDAVLMQTQVLSGDLDTILTLFDPSGVEIAMNDDANVGAYNYNSALYYVAQAAGTYTTAVSNYSGTGNFALTVTVQSSAVPADTVVASDHIDDVVGAVSYSVELEAGETLTAQTQSITGSLDTILTLSDPTGNVAVENDDVNTDSGNFNSTIVYTANEAGTYTLSVARYGSSIGNFLLTTSTSADASVEPITVSNQTFTERGTLNETTPEFSYPLTLEAGQTVLLQTEAITDALDTVMVLVSPSGATVAENDDYQSESYNSGLVYTADENGSYTAVVTGYGDSMGDFNLTVTLGGVELIEQLDNLKRVQLSGPMLSRATEHFVIHYTTEGEDAASQEYVQAATEIVELVWDTEINQLGWAQPPPDNEAGGDNRFDLYLVNIFNEAGECLYGYAAPEQAPGDNPNTPEIETRASTSYMVVDNDYNRQDPVGGTCGGEGTSQGDLLTTMAHEFNHAIQFGYDAGEPHKWMFEAVATWLETQLAGDNQQATPYVSTNFEFPEICFGSKESTLVYGHWMFIQSLVDAYGPGVVEELWQNSISYDGFAALETTVKVYGDDVPTAMSRYFLQNLVRDYELADLFDAQPWLENIINGTGSFTFTGNGIQELAANYFEVQLPPGVYTVTLTGGQSSGMRLWAVGIHDSEAEAFALESGGTFSNEGYDYFYLMVFNPVFDEDVDECSYYTDYAIQIDSGSSAPAPLVQIWNASKFAPLGQ